MGLTICCCKFALTQFWKILELPIWVLDFERKFGFNGKEKLGGTKSESFDVNEGLLGVQRKRERVLLGFHLEVRGALSWRSWSEIEGEFDV